MLRVNTEASKNKKAAASRKFAEDLSNEDANLKIYLQDERLTSVSAHKTLNDLNVSHKQRKESVDRLAACEILDFYIRVNGGK